MGVYACLNIACFTSLSTLHLKLHWPKIMFHSLLLILASVTNARRALRVICAQISTEIIGDLDSDAHLFYRRYFGTLNQSQSP